MPAATTAKPNAALAGSLRDAIGRLGRRMRAERAPSDLSLGQWAALRTLDSHGPMTPSELAAHEKVQPPSVTKILANLESHGYVTRTPDPVDRRQVVVAASDAGLTLLADDRRRKDKWVSQRLATLEPSERAALAAALPVLEKLSRS
ncbi:MAG TPA: MarR family transcriptional regulator [Mycobacteriales bacterium]|jgi:DNA-binding MarR family transcriptional regulator|nr:MarR family transcriptional regulator [Mycobacteriales bacterium]